VKKLARDGFASKRSITDAILGLFREAYKPAFHIYRAVPESFFYVHSATVDSFVIVSFFLDKHHIPHSAVLSLTNLLRLCQIMPMFWLTWLLFWV